MAMKKLPSKRTRKFNQPKHCKRGRPIQSHSVRVVPVFRDEIDVRKLGRAALRLAMRLEDTEQELAEARRYGIGNNNADNVNERLDDEV